MSGEDRGDSAGRRPGRNTTFSSKAYAEDVESVDELMDPELTGAKIASEDFDGFHQPTAMFDKGQFLGELADLQDGGPDTRAAVEAAEAPKGVRLIIVAGPDLGMEWSFKGGDIHIGRDEDCELMLSDIAVSRKHARIALQGEHYTLADLGSNNGTFLNGARIENEMLSPGDEILIGERTMRFVELNESPSTAAAHPIPPGGPNVPKEPEIGDVDFDEDSFSPLEARRSAVDVDAVAAKNEPQLGSSVVPTGKSEPGPGAALRKAIGFLALVALLTGLGVGGFLAYKHFIHEKELVRRQEQAKREFLQAVELVKARRYGDAILLLDRVSEVRPDYVRVAEYRDHAQKEIAVWRELEAARELAEQKRYTEAIEQLRQITKDSGYYQEAQGLVGAYNRAIALDMVRDARAKQQAGDLDGALDLLARALERAPDLGPAQQLLAAIEAERAGRPVPKPKPKSFAIPPILTRAVALYKNKQIAAGIDAAEAAGGPEGAAYAARMKRMKKLYRDASVAHRKKAAGELLRLVPAALEIDAQIAGGKGKVRSTLNSYYADGLYLKGITAYGRRDYAEAAKRLRDALRVKPNHRLAKSKLSELSKKARTLYYEATMIRETNKTEARRLFKQVRQIAPPGDKYHRLASDWLKKNG